MVKLGEKSNVTGKKCREVLWALDLFACKNYNMKSRKNVFIRFARDIFSLLGCNFYAKKSGLNLIYAHKTSLHFL